MSKKTIGVVTFTIIAGFGTAVALKSQSGTKTGHIPLVVEYEIKDAMNNVIRETHYYRADGSVAQSIAMNGDSRPQVHVVDLTAKRTFLKDPITKLYDEFPLTTRLYNSHLHVPTVCEKATIKAEKCHPIGSEELLGYKLQKVTASISNEPGAATEMYLAPELDFIEMLRYFRNADGKITFSKRAISIQKVNPDASVFELPADFTKVSLPSELISAGEVARNRPDPNVNAEHRQKFDEAQMTKRANQKDRVQ
jgi:hypothetical protein